MCTLGPTDPPRTQTVRVLARTHPTQTNFLNRTLPWTKTPKLLRARGWSGSSPTCHPRDLTPYAPHPTLGPFATKTRQISLPLSPPSPVATDPLGRDKIPDKLIYIHTPAQRAPLEHAHMHSRVTERPTPWLPKLPEREGDTPIPGARRGARLTHTRQFQEPKAHSDARTHSETPNYVLTLQ